jgi:hypothetical protein
LAAFVKYHPMVVRRWIENGQLPVPVVVAALLVTDKVPEGDNDIAVYTVPEANAILEALVTHQQSFRYFRTTHKDTIERIQAAIGRIRGE